MLQPHFDPADPVLFRSTPIDIYLGAAGECAVPSGLEEDGEEFGHSAATTAGKAPKDRRNEVAVARLSGLAETLRVMAEGVDIHTSSYPITRLIGYRTAPALSLGGVAALFWRGRQKPPISVEKAGHET